MENSWPFESLGVISILCTFIKLFPAIVTALPPAHEPLSGVMLKTEGAAFDWEPEEELEDELLEEELEEEDELEEDVVVEEPEEEELDDAFENPPADRTQTVAVGIVWFKLRVEVL